MAVGVERERKLTDSINNQAKKLNVGSQLICRQEDVFAAISKLYQEQRRFDIIMMAPPQYVRLVDQTLAALAECPLVKPDGLIICQHDTSETSQIGLHGFPVLQRREYGNTTFTVLGPRNVDTPSSESPEAT